MFGEIRAAVVMLLVMTALTGFVYPLAITGIAQVIFPNRANGSILTERGRLAGSELIGQPFSGPGYFWPRPSATIRHPYNSAASSGSNLGPLSPELRQQFEDRVRALRSADPGNQQPIPADLATTSGSGLDPHISPEAAHWQVARVARARALDPSAVAQLVRLHTQGRQFGILGQPRVNVAAINRALDALK